MREFFIIYPSEDGTMILGPLLEESLRESIEPDEHGDIEFKKILDHIPNIDGNYWGSENCCLIIEGKILVPKIKETISSYDI